MANDKTEKATPKRREEARKKGQVARSADVNGSVVLLASLLALAAFGPRMVEEARVAMTQAFAAIATPDVVSARGLGRLLVDAGRHAVVAVAPVALVCLVAGVLANVAQVRWKPSLQGLKPDPKRLNPLQGAKNVFGPNAIFETAKSIAKVAVVAAVVAWTVIPRIEELGALVAATPAEIAAILTDLVFTIAWRAGLAYLVIAAIDYAYQWHRHEKSLRMDKHEVKEEFKQQGLPPEVRSALRRRQMDQARARMMAAVPEADVVVTNPTHYAVALRYDPAKAAPEVVAKGKDLIAARIREIAREHDVPEISNPPLARELHRTVEVGHVIPEALYQAVAELLAFVYRTAGRRRAAALA